MSTREPTADELEALAMGALESTAKERKTVLKGIVGQSYADGDKHPFRSPIGSRRKLGEIRRTDPDPEWKITDRALLDEFIRANYPGSVVTSFDIVDHDAAVDVLREHRPELLAEIERIDQAARDALLAESREKEEAAAPGISLVKAPGVMTVAPAAGAFEEFGRLVRAGVLTWDFRPALPAADDESEAAS